MGKIPSTPAPVGSNDRDMLHLWRTQPEHPQAIAWLLA